MSKSRSLALLFMLAFSLSSVQAQTRTYQFNLGDLFGGTSKTPASSAKNPTQPRAVPASLDATSFAATEPPPDAAQLIQTIDTWATRGGNDVIPELWRAYEVALALRPETQFALGKLRAAQSEVLIPNKGRTLYESSLIITPPLWGPQDLPRGVSMDWNWHPTWHSKIIPELAMVKSKRERYYRHWMLLAAEGGHLQAQIEVGRPMDSFQRPNIDSNLYLTKAVAQNSPEAHYLLSRMYELQVGYVDEALRRSQAGGLLVKSAELGWPEGQMLLGRRMARGEGMRQQIAEGVRWLEKAMAAGSLGAIHEMALLYLEEVKGIAANKDKALGHLRAAAQQGYVPSIQLAGQLGDPQYVTTVAESGDPVAAFYLAIYQMEGSKGFKRSPRDALTNFIAAKNGGVKGTDRYLAKLEKDPEIVAMRMQEAEAARRANAYSDNSFDLLEEQRLKSNCDTFGKCGELRQHEHQKFLIELNR